MPPLFRFSCIGLTCLGTGLCPADTLFLENHGGNAGATTTADVSLLNERRIVGLQFDLKIPAGQAVPSAALAAAGMEHHRLSSRVEGGKLKVVVHSPTNAELPSAEILSIPLALGAGAPEGGPAYVVENLIFTNAAGQSISAAVFYHPLEVWRQERFSEAQREDPEIVGDLKDPDGDGYTNIMEFLFATNPLVADGKGIAAAGLTRRKVPGPGGELVAGPVVFSFEFPRVKGAEGVDLWVESSPDLKTWTRESAVPVKAGQVDSVTERMRFVIESDPATVRRKFFRVGVARVETAAAQPGSVPKVGYAEWAARYFNPAELGNAALAGEQADADGDSLVNLLEYLLGSDPRVPSTAALPVAGLVMDQGVRAAQLKYGVSRETTGAYLLIEASTDLLSWTPVEFSASPTGRASATAVEIGATIEGFAPHKQFFRFQVSDTP